MFTKILIANRGEIACRVAATARRLGIRTVAVYSDADANAAHVQACDEAVRLGPAAARDSYLRADLILAAAQATGAQAVHPGYGFLSENEGFAQACADAGIAFIGPPASAIAAMGSKSAAKQLMEQADVPLVPGYHGDNQDTAFLREQATRIGYPVLIKASSGGGGKGMRVVRSEAEFDAALASCQREAAASFGSAQVLVERYLQRPRHIEIQVFGDTQGHYVHLFERDCSVQRRHQKVLEEAPAPGMKPEHRSAMGSAAIAAARSVGYVGAGTVEFIVEHDFADTGRFYFMEMNTRLQVEHPVTEAITGHDLVEWQLRVAAGEPLPVTQDQLAVHGHAIEARICAENPDQQFLPAVGRLRLLRTPDAASFTRANVRIDSGVREGDEITPHYDSMIAKLIVWAPDRAQALVRLDAALAQLHISDLGEGGLHTNVDFLRRVAATDSFNQADLDTGLIEREQAALFVLTEPSRAWLVAAAAARLLHTDAAGSQSRGPADTSGQHTRPSPWGRADAWRLQAGQGRRWLDLAVQGQNDALHGMLVHHRDGTLALEIDGLRRSFQVQPLSVDLFDITLDDERRRLNIHRHGAIIEVFGDKLHARLSLSDPFLRTTGGDTHAGQLVTQMPGRVLALLVSAGQQVSKGQPLVVTEAMKMEHTLSAPRDGTVAELLCQVGDQVAEGTELLRLDATA
ncbi:acetyl/propionyl/methylcrotonyl-CoA carboxylase subunit alpha [Aquabacterium soli]|uniref:Acetyl/propionyl/methylcrotonyl-CoA carboxylase subunit alpha n=1 Tax=Aquabacterium soli TaxID=2493092 RepID=A0A426VCS2_9BURK|nr:acetyl/propionyl/methylcrotonyl-CoA carboxylase subunit alpha [Aquabacterium soli]RRS04665.1 acetyl/propionyl/methylcrotonyl-CoA carboxylase subunit alpha [Aquabacterium soli]